MRRTRAGLATAALTGLALVAGGFGGAPAAVGADASDPYGEVRNILPPGQSGTVTAADLLEVGPSREATATTPENFADQLEMYDALATKDPDRLAEADLGALFKRAGFEPEQVTREASPREGVSIRWDRTSPTLRASKRGW